MLSKIKDTGDQCTQLLSDVNQNERQGVTNGLSYLPEDC